jgi:hypothetical protein
MTEQEWLATTEPRPMLDFLMGKFCDRKWRLLGCACCRHVGDKLTDPRCEGIIDRAEAFADAKTNRERAAIHEVRRLANGLLAEHAGSHSIQAVRSLLLPSAVRAASSAAAYAVSVGSYGYHPRKREQRSAQVPFIRDIFGNPFRPVSLDPSWLTSTVLALAESIYADRAFDRLPILADALQDAGCENTDVLDHCRGPGPHVRGCWVVDILTDRT